MGDELTAKDIENQEFTRRMRGLDPQEVRLFLKSTADVVERLHFENAELREYAARLERDAEGCRERERTLQETLVSAQRMADEMRENARREADVVMREARCRAEAIVKQAQDSLTRIEMDIANTRMERETLEQRLRGVLDQHLSVLEMRRQSRAGRDNVAVMPSRAGSEAG